MKVEGKGWKNARVPDKAHKSHYNRCHFSLGILGLFPNDLYLRIVL